MSRNNGLNLKMPITHFACKPWLQVFFDIRIFILIILFFGNFSDAQNHALFRPALHSWIPNSHDVTGAEPHNTVDLHGAERAVDSNVSSYSLSDTGDINQHAAWSVILEGYTIVQRVTIVAAEEKYRYLESIVVVVEKSTEEMEICAEFHNASALKPSARLYLNCPTSPIGGRVTIHRAGGYEPWKLALAEVIVEGILISGNQALQKPTRQIGTSEEYFSSNAVDRNPYSCSLTDDPENRLAWWQVDLGHVFFVKSVKITVDGPQHLKVYYKEIMVTVDHTDVTDSNRSCVIFNYDIFKGPVSITYECVMPLEGRYVTIRRRGESMQQQTLGLCNVEVIGDYAGLTVGDPIIKADPATPLAASSFFISKSSSNSEASNEHNEEGSSAMKSGPDTSINCSIFGSVQYFWVALASLTFVVFVLVNRLIIIKYMNRRIINIEDQNTEDAYKYLANSLDSDVQLLKR